MSGVTMPVSQPRTPGRRADEPETAALPGWRAVTAAAGGKVILLGEHAVVHGARAVAMPLTAMRIAIRLTPDGSPGASGRGPRITLGGEPVDDHLLAVVREALDLLGLPDAPIDLATTSTLPVGAGLGSSAALCVALLRVLATATGRALSSFEVATLANRLERRFHGNPSGLDASVVALEQVIAFRRGEAPEAVPVAHLRTRLGGLRPWRFAVIDTGERTPTIAMVERAAPYFLGAEGARRVAHFDRLTDTGLRALATGDEPALVQAMRQADVALDEAGIVTPLMRRFMDTVTDAGALAAKATGAGGGGCVLALLGEDLTNDRLRQLGERLGTHQISTVELPGGQI